MLQTCLDDAWELAHFDNLSHDGHADDDGDGLTDLQEFLAGTNPRNSSSALTVILLSRAGGGATVLLWSAVAGRSYQVQFKNDVTDASWKDLPGIVTASDSTATYEDTTATLISPRFYRVIALQ